jgi:hypothetical protein
MTRIEVLMCTLFVSVVLVGAMNVLGAAVSGRTKTTNAVRAQLLAQQLMAEILSAEYVDGGLLPVFGPELLEANGTRNNFDDVDDYDGWDSSPPESRDGARLPNSTGWRRTVVVERVDPLAPMSIAASDKGLKRITVTVYQGATVAARLVALRSNAYTP